MTIRTESATASRTSRSIVRWLAALALALPAAATATATATDQETEEKAATEPQEFIVISGRRSSADSDFAVDPKSASPAVADTAALFKTIPGADVIDNGPLSGQVQYRGLFGPRMNVRVDGMHTAPGGPNWMDAPLHYAPRPLVESLELERGIASVSSGIETLAGSVRATTKQSAFTDEESFSFHSDLNAQGRSVDQGFAGGGIVSVANRRHRLHVLGSAEIGDDIDTAAGRLTASEHRRFNYGGGYGLRLGEHEFGIDYRRSDTDNTGNPELPMDIRFIDTDLLRGNYTGTWQEVTVQASLDYTNVDHAMDNFSLRPPTMMKRLAPATSETLGYELVARIPLQTGTLSLGADGDVSEHDMNVFDPDDAAFFVNNFSGARRDRYGAFAEWRGNPFERWSLELGARYVRVESDAGEVDLSSMAAPALLLRDTFNAADREQSDDDVDLVAKLEFAPRDELHFEFGVARKTRSPFYIERYAWLPLEVTAGLADGHNYVGDVDLDPEVSSEVEAGVSWRSESVYLAPRAFYRRVNDYIQGVKIPKPPLDSLDAATIMVSTANGDDSPLRFTNVDARLYGVDAEYGVALPLGFQIDGNVSYVRGVRIDVNDNLYRIAPLRGRTTLSYRYENWSAGVEGVYAARQDKVSAENDETGSPSYALMNLFVGFEPKKGIDFTLGIDNVLDALYEDHLSGTNRVMDSAVPVGTRLPGAGRNFFGRVGWRW